MDQKLTKQIQDWLNAMPEQQDIVKGATMLLQLNRNRILYQNILRNPVKLKGKLVYELQKHLNIRLDGLTVQDVKVMDDKVRREVLPTVARESAKVGATPDDRKGWRKNHEQLPAAVQQLFYDAHAKMVEMRSIHERLKLMENDRPCDRYPYLKQLIKLHDEYRALYNRYDEYDTNRPVDDQPTAAETEPENLTKALATYRGYVVTNIDKLAELVKAGKKGKADKLRAKMQERYDECKRLHVVFSDESVAKLNELGIE